MSQTITGEPLAKITHVFEQKILMDYNDPLKHKDLKHIMDALPHIKLKDGYSLGCFRPTDNNSLGAHARLYPFRTGSNEIYDPESELRLDKEYLYYRSLMEEKEKQGDDGEIFFLNNILNKYSPKPFRDGQHIEIEIGYLASKTIPKLNDYVEIDLSPESVWESMLLLEESVSYLPHFWHAKYSEGILLVDDLSFNKVKYNMYDMNFQLELIQELKVDVQSLKKNDMSELESYYLNTKEKLEKLWSRKYPDCSIYPTVNLKNEKEAVVSYCRWDDWHGVCLKIAHACIKGHSICFKYEDPYTIIPFEGPIQY